MFVIWWLVAGSNYSSGTLATTWGSQTDANRAVGQVNLFDSTSNEYYITGVQLEVGDQATPFEHLTYAEELTLCERYYQELPLLKIEHLFNTAQQITLMVAFAVFGDQ